MYPIKLEFFLDGDVIMGLSSATANYACLWCNTNKADRWDTSHPFDLYCKEPLKRTLVR